MTLLLNPKFWLALAAAAALAWSHVFVYRAGEAAIRNEWAEQKLVDVESLRLAGVAREKRYETRQKTTDKEARDGQEKIAALETDLGAARTAAERLRAAIRTVTAAAGPGQAAGAAGTGQGQPDSDPVGMFAHLYERADARAERVGGFADRVRIAAEVCERYADGLQTLDGQ